MCAVGRVVGADAGIAQDAFGNPCDRDPAYRMVVPVEIGLVVTWVAVLLCKRHGAHLHEQHPDNVTGLDTPP